MVDMIGIQQFFDLIQKALGWSFQGSKNAKNTELVCCEEKFLDRYLSSDRKKIQADSEKT